MPTGSKSAPSSLTVEIGDLIRARLSRKRITQAALAEASGISSSQLSKYLGGKKSPTLDELDRICWIVGMDLSDLVREADRLTDSRLMDYSDPLTTD